MVSETQKRSQATKRRLQYRISEGRRKKLEERNQRQRERLRSKNAQERRGPPATSSHMHTIVGCGAVGQETKCTVGALFASYSAYQKISVKS